jgi:flagellar hook protein FlgE
MKVHQTQMDVIGNNIANVSTTAFKSSRVTFKDVYYQTLKGASGSSAVSGGSNATQIGYGTALSTIDVINTRSGIQTTDRALDLYISGEGYFKVTDGVKDDSNGTVTAGASAKYTRNGNFGFDASGDLVDANGNYVFGWLPDVSTGDFPVVEATTTTSVDGGNPIVITDINTYTDIAIAPDGTITGVKDNQVKTLARIGVSKFSNPDGLSQQDGVYFLETKNSGTTITTYPGTQSTGTIVSGGLEMSNVDLSTELTSMITAERGFQANSRVITVSDEMLQELVNLKR